ncbi:MAG: hypothetical protein ABIA21_03990 [Candidatus Aenigmatarchaeota archaeon]
MIEDIGHLIFVQILRVADYPGAPFTGNIISDLVLYLFLPLVFTILIIYMLLARMFPEGYKGIKLLMGIAIFLFAVFSGYFGIIIYITGPYFTFLLFGVGILTFLGMHFRPAGGGGEYRTKGHPKWSGGDQSPPLGGGGSQVIPISTGKRAKRLAELKKELHSLEGDLRELKDEAKMASASAASGNSAFVPTYDRTRSVIQQRLMEIRREMSSLGADINPVEAKLRELHGIEHAFFKNTRRSA